MIAGVRVLSSLSPRGLEFEINEQISEIEREGLHVSGVEFSVSRSEYHATYGALLTIEDPRSAT